MTPGSAAPTASAGRRSEGRVVDVVVRAADAGDTYLSWRWLDDVHTPHASRLSAATLKSVLERLDDALIAPRSGEDPDGVRRALTEGDFSNLAAERDLADHLTAAALPAPLVQQLLDRVDRGFHIRFRLTPSPMLARIPWEVMAVDPTRRLIEVADITYDPPAIIHASRSRPAVAWRERRTQPAVFIVDPKFPTSRGPRPFGPVFDGVSDSKVLRNRIREHEEIGGADAGAHTDSVGRLISREDLSDLLRAAPRSRFFYFGHVTATPDEPGTASLHLSDPAMTWGMAEPKRIKDFPTDHRPLSALDLMLGTTMTADPAVWTLYGADRPQAGHEIWPMPPRVALIACESGIDYRSAETFGLVIAMLDAGAELVTTTRWPLPTGKAFRDHHPDLPRGVSPPVDLGLAVDHAHTLDDPVHHLADWQRGQLQLWRAHGEIQYSPLLWAALIHTLAPMRTEQEPRW